MAASYDGNWFESSPSPLDWKFKYKKNLYLEKQNKGDGSQMKQLKKRVVVVGSGTRLFVLFFFAGKNIIMIINMMMMEIEIEY